MQEEADLNLSGYITLDCIADFQFSPFVMPEAADIQK